MRRAVPIVVLIASALAANALGVTTHEATVALHRLDEDLAAAKGGKERAAAIARLGSSVHAKIAKRLFELFEREESADARIAAVKALAAQEDAARKTVPKLEKWLIATAEARAAQARRGDPGFRLDPDTGKADTKSEEGRRSLAALAAEESVNLAALRALVALDGRKKLEGRTLAAFLLSADDDLVIETLGALGRGHDWTALPAILDLYRTYPKPNRWESGGTVDPGGTGVSAQARWMVRFGHPAKQRPRPKVVEAIQAALKAITGREISNPIALAAFLAKPDVKARVEPGHRRRH